MDLDPRLFNRKQMPTVPYCPSTNHQYGYYTVCTVHTGKHFCTNTCTFWKKIKKSRFVVFLLLTNLGVEWGRTESPNLAKNGLTRAFTVVFFLFHAKWCASTAGMCSCRTDTWMGPAGCGYTCGPAAASCPHTRGRKPRTWQAVT